MQWELKLIGRIISGRSVGKIINNPQFQGWHIKKLKIVMIELKRHYVIFGLPIQNKNGAINGTKYSRMEQVKFVEDSL